ARARRSRPQEHARGAEVAEDLVRQRAPVLERHLDQRLARALDALADRLGHLARLSVAGAYHARAVADHHARAEVEAAAATAPLRGAVDVDDAVGELVVVGVQLRHGSLTPTAGGRLRARRLRAPSRARGRGSRCG